MYLTELDAKYSSKPAPAPAPAPETAEPAPAPVPAPVEAEPAAIDDPPPVVYMSDAPIVLVPDAPAAPEPAPASAAVESKPPADQPAADADAAARRRKNRWGSKATDEEVAAAAPVPAAGSRWGAKATDDEAAAAAGGAADGTGEKAARVKKKRRFDAVPIRKRTFTRFGERKLPGI